MNEEYERLWKRIFGKGNEHSLFEICLNSVSGDCFQYDISYFSTLFQPSKRLFPPWFLDQPQRLEDEKTK